MRFIVIIVMMLSMTLVTANKETYYSAYVTEASDEKTQLAQVTDMRASLGGSSGEGYKIRNTLSTPMLVNDWEEPHRTMLVIAGTEKPIDETEATAIHSCLHQYLRYN